MNREEGKMNSRRIHSTGTSPRRGKPILRRLLASLLWITGVVSLFVFVLWIYIAQPSFQSSSPVERVIDTDRLREVVQKLSVEFHPRNHANLANLDRCADYLVDQFSETSGKVSVQTFAVAGKTYRNVSCLFEGQDDSRLIVGAHYDSHGNTPGADDNASGVAGLVELAHLLSDQNLPIDVELVAFTLEEPPYFATAHMGSHHHAKSLQTQGIDVLGMLALEMIGYFSDEPGSQSYPAPVLRLIYPSRGNFIGVIGNLDHRTFTKKIKLGMKGSTDLPVYSISAPSFVPGIDFSDHRNYWEHGYPAAMISDTAFYRNQQYHESGDTWDRLDYEKMGKVVLGVYSCIQSF